VRVVTSLLVLAFVAMLMRSTALSALAARGVVLDVLACVAVVWALSRGESWGATFGFVLGLFADLDAAHWLGRHALALALIGYVVGRLSHTLVRNSARTQMVLFLLATLVHLTWVSLFESSGWAGAPALAGHIAVAAVASAVAATAVLGIARRLGGRPLFGHATAGPGPVA
jgi:rod shape-determining protein MreD